MLDRLAALLRCIPLFPHAARILISFNRPAAVAPVEMWSRREAACPSYPLAPRRDRLPPASGRRAPNAAARRCTTRRLNAHITSEQRVLYDWHPWAGRIVTVHSVLDIASDSVARCSLAREATGLPLEVPLWMFDRMMCSSARREHHPQVVITALADLQARAEQFTLDI